MVDHDEAVEQWLWYQGWSTTGDGRGKKKSFTHTHAQTKARGRVTGGDSDSDSDRDKIGDEERGCGSPQPSCDNTTTRG